MNMLKNRKSQGKPDSNLTKYLIINSIVLDPITSSRVCVEDDLVLRQHEEGIFSVLKEGKLIAQYLDRLTNDQGYSIILFSNRKERQILHTLAQFDEACKREGLKSFPKIAAIVVKDRESYPQVKASKLKVAEARSHGILIAGYGLQPQQEIEILNGISKLPILDKFDQNSCLVFDNRPSFIKKAREERWRVNDICSTPLKETLWELCNHPARPIVQSHRRLSTELDDIEEDQEDLMDDKPKINMIPAFEIRTSISQSPDNSPAKQNQQNLKTEPQRTEKNENKEKSENKEKTGIFSAFSNFFNLSPIKNVLRKVTNGIAPNDTQAANVLESQDIPLQDTDGFQPHDYHHGVEDLLNVVIKRPFTNERDKIHTSWTPWSETYEETHKDETKHENLQKKENPAPANEEEKEVIFLEQTLQEETAKTTENITYQENSMPEKPFISEIEFEPLHKPRPGGSSFTRWFTDKENKMEWVGKCSVQAIKDRNQYDEYKEYLASQLYKLLGVKVPKTILSSQYLENNIQKDELWRKCNINQPRLHILSQVVPGFELLGERFVEDYKNSSKKNQKELFCLGERKVPLEGFGRVMAVAILSHDYDFIGNTGRNIGYIPSENGEYFEIFKIDPGAALELEEDIKYAPKIQNPLKNREAVIGSKGEKISYNELNEIDQKEFIQTLKEILEIKTSTFEEIFLPYFKVNAKFQRAFEEFLNRRTRFLSVFESEVRNLIKLQIQELEKQRAEKHACNWGKPLTLTRTNIEQKAKLLRNKAQLGAFTAAEDSNDEGSKQLQLSQVPGQFVGRETELSKLEKVFKENTGIIQCVIVGGAGLGKSLLAKEYLIRNQAMYSEVFWFHAEQSDFIADHIQIYLETCHKRKFEPQEKVNKTSIIKQFYQILGKVNDSSPNKTAKKTCIIFDNADSVVDIADYLPDKSIFPTLKIDILITSRNNKWGKLPAAIIEMKAFEIRDVKNYVDTHISNIEINQSITQFSKDLNELTDGLPLALSLTMAYIQRKGMSIDEFCSFISKEKNKEFMLLQSGKKEKSTESEGESKSLSFVSTIFTLTLADLKRKNHHVELILDILAYLSPDDISISLLEEWWSYCQSTKRHFDSQLQEFDKYSLGNMPIHEQQAHIGESHIAMIKSFRDAVELLLSYSIIIADLGLSRYNEIENILLSDMKISINSLTQQVIRLNHQRSGNYESYYSKVFEWMVKKLEYDEKDLDDVKRVSLLIPHAIHLKDLQNTINKLKMAELQEKIGYHQLYGVGKYHVALKYFENALAIKENYYGKDHPKTAATLGNLGNVWGSLGDYEKKKDLLTRALEIYEKHYGKDHPNTAATLGNLGYAWGSLGDYEKQKDILTRALTIKEKCYGKDHPTNAITLTNLGNAWGSIGDYEKQKDLLTRALDIYEKHYGRDHPQTAITLGGLGNAWGSLGNYEKQRDLLTQALEIFERHYGKNHPETAATLTNLGNAWGSLGNYEKQKDLLTQALAIDEKHYGKDHPETAITLTNLGNAWGSLGDYVKQRDLLTRALEIKENHYGKDHPQTYGTILSLGKAWGALGDHEKKQKFLNRALGIKTKKNSLGNRGILNDYLNQK